MTSKYLKETIGTAREVMAYHRRWKGYREQQKGEIARIFAIGDKMAELLPDGPLTDALRLQWKGVKLNETTRCDRP